MEWLYILNKKSCETQRMVSFSNLLVGEGKIRFRTGHEGPDKE
jgi:hypothetical protein